MSRTISVAVIGASGLVGEALLGALASSGLPIGRVLGFGSANRSPRVDSGEYGGESVGIQPISRVGELEADVAFLCVPPVAAPRVAAMLSGRVGRIVDVGGSGDAPLFHPVMPGFPEGGQHGVRCPSAAGATLTALVAPLVEAGLDRVTGTVSLAASSRGRAAMEELGQQVIAQLSNQDPPRRVFATGLAFDALAEDGPADEWSDREQQAAQEVAELTSLAMERVAVQIGTFPLFSGAVASLHLRGVDVATAEEAWRASPLLREVIRADKLRPRAFTNRAEVGWGRLRADPMGEGVHVWAVSDPVAVAAYSAVEAVRRILGLAAGQA